MSPALFLVPRLATLALTSLFAIGLAHADRASGDYRRERLLSAATSLKERREFEERRGSAFLIEAGVKAHAGVGFGLFPGIGLINRHGKIGIRLQLGASVTKGAGVMAMAGVGPSEHTNYLGAGDATIIPTLQRGDAGGRGLVLAGSGEQYFGAEHQRSEAGLVGIGLGSMGRATSKPSLESRRVNLGFTIPFIQWKSRTLRLTTRGERLVNEAIARLDRGDTVGADRLMKKIDGIGRRLKLSL